MVEKINYKALMQIKACKDRLTPQQFKTLKGQVLAGNADGAMKGLRKVLGRQNGC